ncbi:MAG: acyltransferase family protein [Actinobacteria bacterium]|uniref:Unannotated protein n=1 Tax=freshwater metagenome TaxID=449393 RepID=A0A6J7GC62_9ZZZZ|nr:acyltransferase family protein [Actinomycetota bacterium]
MTEPARASIWRTTQSVSAALNGHANSLGLLRLVLAAMVIFNHAFPLGGFATEDPLWGWTHHQASMGSLAVDGFFAISGYLIAKSALSSDILQYLWRRVLRIFPAFWLMLLVSAVLIAPIFWMLSGQHLADFGWTGPQSPLSYVRANSLLHVGTWGIYDIFGNTPYGRFAGTSVFNGSIWTLEFEFFAYLVVGFLAVTALLARFRLIVPILAAALTVFVLISTSGNEALRGLFPFLFSGYDVSDTGAPYRVSLLLIFLIGSTFAMFSRSVASDWRIAAGSIVVLVGSLTWGGYQVVGIWAFTYVLLWLAGALPRRLQWIGQKNDYSYGVYIYGFLVQQMLAFFNVQAWGYWPFVLIALVISFGFAWLSWHAIEKWAMRLKDWGPGRGIATLSNRVRLRSQRGANS